MSDVEGGREAAAAPDAHDPAELLVKALGTLPQAERDHVYAWLLRRGFAAGPAPLDPGLGMFRPEPGSLAAAFLRPGGSLHGSSASRWQQMVPVRFTSEQHAQLREWCAEHGFSMATVIRGLVARFLEGQLPGTGQPA